MEAPLVLNSSFESWPLKEQTAKILGFPQVAVTPTAQILADGDGWLWFEPAAQRDFPAASQEEALARVQRRAVGSHLRPLLRQSCVSGVLFPSCEDRHEIHRDCRTSRHLISHEVQQAG
ncbi:MAG TPA: hypothetical protein PLD30_16840 [Candidatus Competibacteraceae bacterium]|nr:hypothetical protein [Candidatus Competibacteraceae bacterium]